MNKDLIEVIKLYSTASHKELNNFLLDKSKDNLIAILNDLLTLYINDKNSSTIREFITTTISGYIHNENKIGYNGFRQITLNSENINEYCEVKPKNIITNTNDLNNVNKKSKNKLNAGGNFTDYTWERFDRDLNANLNMLISGFVDGKLIYILEFPFSNQSFINKLQLQLNKKFPNRQRNKNDYLRSANFDFKDFMFNENNEKNNNFKINFLLTKQELENYKNYFNKKFFDELLKYAK